MISLSAQVFDLAGSVQINPLPGDGDGVTRRRVNRVTTLDGGVVINDGGYAEGDRTLVYSWKAVSKAHNNSIKRLVETYSLLTVATPDGVYSAAPESFTPGQAESTLVLLVKYKLA